MKSAGVRVGVRRCIPLQSKSNCRALVLLWLLATGCTTNEKVGSGLEAEQADTYEGGSPEKYPSIPEDGPVDLSIPPDSVLLGELNVSVGKNEMQRFFFSKQAGQRYIIGLTGLSGDLDLYSHYRPEVSRNDYQFVSWAYGTTEEQIDVNATQTGDYYIGIWGYEAAQAKLQLFASPQASQTDEVGWPVEWGNDSASSAVLVGGGLNWLERWNYGGTCGYVYHPGLDLNFGTGSEDLGKPVAAVANGVVTGSGYSSKGWGNVITIEHTLSTGLRFESLYGHLDTRLVQVGTQVSRGQQIGTVGHPPGGSPHLHFEIRKNVGLSTFAFPCGQQTHSVEGNYHEPAEFIRTH